MTEARSTTDEGGFVLRAIPPPETLPAATRPFAGSVSLKLAPGDGMYKGDDSDYYECGASALNVILTALQLAHVPAPTSILDFGAGAGRVTRWLRAAFPSATIGACDLREQDMQFCRTEFRAETWTSGTDIEALHAPAGYDLIWAGSVLTHLSAENTRLLVDKLLSWTNPGGLLVVSTIGRVARVRRDDGGDDYIHPEAWASIKSLYETLGFGYADYHGQTGYGLSLTKLSWLGRLVEAMPTARLILLSEGVWDNLHDVLALQHSPLVESRTRAFAAPPPGASPPARMAEAESAAQLLEREREIEGLKARVAALESSTSWKVTAPLRAAIGALRR